MLATEVPSHEVQGEQEQMAEDTFTSQVLQHPGGPDLKGPSQESGMHPMPISPHPQPELGLPPRHEEALGALPDRRPQSPFPQRMLRAPGRAGEGFP